MSAIRIETDGASDLASVYLWLSRHRGQIVEIDRTKRLTFGVPISGARAVIVAVVLQDDGRPGPQLGGVLRAISNRTDAEPVRLVFEGRSPSGLEPAEAQLLAAEIVDRISEQIAADDAVLNVA